MAVYTSAAGAGLWSAGATWVGGVKPPSAAGHSIVIAATSTVTYDETGSTYGDDTATAMVVTGRLQASRIVNTGITLRGDCQMSAVTTAVLDWGRNSTADIIPLGITATWIGNSSAAMANYKYGIFVGEGANFYSCGVTRTRNTTTTSSLAAAGTSVDITNIAGWEVGNFIVFAQTTGIVTQYDRRAILTITPGAGVSGTVTFAAVTFAHALGCPVGNFSSNVTFKSFNTTNPMYMCFRSTSTASNNRREVDHTSFEFVGSDVTSASTKVWCSTTFSSPQTPFRTFTNCSFYNGNNSIGLFFFLLNTTTIFSNHAMFTDAAGVTGPWWYTASGTYYQVEDSVIYFTLGVNVTSGFSQGGQGATYRRCKFWVAANTNAAIYITNGAGLKFENCEFHSNAVGAGFTWLGSGDVIFNSCKFGTSDLPGTPTFYYVADAGTVLGQVGTFRFNDCLFGTPITGFYKNLDKPNLAYITYVSNKNLDPLVQEVYTPNGVISRDNTSKISGVTSLKLAPTSASNSLNFSQRVPAPTGNLVNVSGKIIRDTANVMTVTLSGLGITPSTYTCSGVADGTTIETFSVQGTNTTGTDGILILTFAVTGATGNAWVDNVLAPQSIAIAFGEYGYWADALPVTLITSNQLSAGDVWAFQTSNINTAGSIGVSAKNNLPLIPALL